MRVKDIYKLVLCSLSLLFLGSCDINTLPQDKYPEDAIWGDYATAQGFVNDAYNIMGWLIQNDDWTDNTVLNASQSDAVTFNAENFNSEYNYGWHIFEDVRKCNKIIEKVSESNFREADKTKLLGDAYFLRAVTYFAAARKFGRLIIVDKVLTPEDDMAQPRTKTIKETYDFIIGDLKKATEMLPKDTPKGTPNKGAAYALLAEVYLHGASYLDNSADKNEYYEGAISASKSLFGLNKYSLDSNFAGMFNTYEGALNSPEMILARYHVSQNTTISGTWMQGLCPNMGGDKAKEGVLERWPLDKPLEGWLERTPSQELTDAYLVIDTTDGVAKLWDETAAYKSFVPNSGQQMHDVVYANRDKRFYATIVQDGAQYFTNIITTRLGGNVHYLSNVQQDRHMTKSGYVYRKGTYEDTWLYWNVPTDYAYSILRLGRSYLNYAEALLRHKKEAGVAEAIEYINKTRTVHGGLPALATNLSLEEAWKYYKIERRADLVQENDRYWSLLRWGKADGLDVIPELNQPVHSITIAEDGESFVIDEQLPMPVRASNVRRFTSRRYLLPVPRAEIIENPALKNDQNSGWE